MKNKEFICKLIKYMIFTIAMFLDVNLAVYMGFGIFILKLIELLKEKK